MSDAACPYCQAEVEICHDDGYGYEEDRLHEQECWSCGKTFGFNTMISFDYTVEKVPCFNGEPHQWEPREYMRSQGFKNYRTCVNCHASDPGKYTEASHE